MYKFYATFPLTIFIFYMHAKDEISSSFGGKSERKITTYLAHLGMSIIIGYAGSFLTKIDLVFRVDRQIISSKLSFLLFCDVPL